MTALAEDLDLEYLFSLDSGQPGDDEECNGLFDDEECGLEAVAIAVWQVSCECADQEMLLCSGHCDELGQAVAAGRLFTCAECGTAVLLLRLEPVR